MSEYAKNRRLRLREEARAFVQSVRESTLCNRCGRQPIEWHHDEHPAKPNDRVSSLQAQGASIERIQFEMDRCEALCRSCHMKEDGRLAALRAKAPNQPGDSHPPKPCSCCDRDYKPLRKGMCPSCYIHHSGLRPRKRPNGCGCDSI